MSNLIGFTCTAVHDVLSCCAPDALALFKVIEQSMCSVDRSRYAVHLKRGYVHSCQLELLGKRNLRKIKNVCKLNCSSDVRKF